METPSLSSKKTLLYLITKANWGGAQRYVHDLAFAAVQKGCTVSVVCGSIGTLTDRLHAEGIQTTIIPSLARDISPLKDLRSFFAIIHTIRHIRPHVVHVNSSKAGGIGALAARICRVPCIVFTIHGLPQHEDRPWLAKKLITLLTWLTAILSHQVITVAQSDQTELQRQPFLKHKVQTISNGITYHGVARAQARERLLSHLTPTESHAAQEHPFWVGTVAELTQNKGHRYALEALRSLCERFPKLTYIIIGDGELAETFHAFVQTHNLTDRILFTGFIPNAPELYSAFDIYLSPSIKEGLPYSIIEAMHSSVPIVATSVGGIPEMIVDGASGILIPPHSSHAIVNALSRLASDETLRSTLGQATRAHAHEYYTVETMTTRTFALYEHCPHPTSSQE